MNVSNYLDAMNGPMKTTGEAAVSAMSQAVSTNSTEDHLAALEAYNEYKNLITLRSSVLKGESDLVMGILQKL